MSNHTALAALLLFTFACDPSEDRPAPAPASEPPHAATSRHAPATAPHGAAHHPGSEPQPAAQVPAGQAAPAVGAPVGFTDCLLACDAAKLSHADKAACRYNCEDVRGPSAGVAAIPGAVDIDPVGSVVDCADRCFTGKNPYECVKGCSQAAVGTPGAPEAGVLTELGTCAAACHTGKATSETNRTTCELNCAELARVAGPARPANLPIR